MTDTSDIVIELREMARDNHQPDCDIDTLTRAADEIERLRRALTGIEGLVAKRCKAAGQRGAVNGLRRAAKLFREQLADRKNRVVGTTEIRDMADALADVAADIERAIE